MSCITTKFHAILLSGFSRVVLTNCYSSLSFLSNFEVQKGALLPEKNWNKMSCGYAHLHIMSVITTKFQEILLSGFRGVALTNCFSSNFHFRQNTKFKKSVIQRKKMKSKFPVDMHIYTLCPSLLQVSGNSVEWFQRSCANKKNRSIFPFCQISKFKKGVTPRKKVKSKFPVDMHIYTLCPSLLQSLRKFCWAVSEELR